MEETMVEVIFPTRGIRIVAKSRALGKVLEEIEQESGILFKASPHIAEKQIDETIMAPDWTIAVRKLLREYSRVEILKSDGTLQRVLILDTGGPDYQLPLPLHPKDLSIPKPIRIPQPPPNATH